MAKEIPGNKYSSLFLLFLLLVLSASIFRILPTPFTTNSTLEWKETDPCFVAGEDERLPSDLGCVLRRAQGPENSTLVVTTVNDAWAKPGSLLDVFFQSLQVGRNTQYIRKKLVVVAMDGKAYNRCLQIHPHCFHFEVEGVDFTEEKVFMTKDYLELKWRMVDFYRSILELGYDFVFTDTDVMWLRDPLDVFRGNASVDIAIACDHYHGSPVDVASTANTGFFYLRSNNRTIKFLKHWRNAWEFYPNDHDQHGFNMIKGDGFSKNLGIRFKFLDTKEFSGFCEMGEDLGKVYTIHSNCCVSLRNKMHDLRIVLEDWGNFTSGNSSTKWRIPQWC